MDPSYYPPSLRVPAGGDLTRLMWRAEVGRGARVGDIANLLRDLDTAINLGERWGATFARTAAQYELAYDLRRNGPQALAEEASQYGVDPRARYEDGGLFDTSLRGQERTRSNLEELILEVLIEVRARNQLGSAIATERVEYRNPVDVVLTGAGFLIVGTISVLRLIRDWSSTRRQGNAAAQAAESNTRQQSTQADLMEWLVDEAKAGRLHVRPSDLLNVVSTSDSEALRRLSAQDTQLELPPGGNPPQ